MKVLITGGHITPALAVIEELKKKKGIQIVFVGRKFTSQNEHIESFEYQEVISLDIFFIHLEAGRLTRIASFSSFINLLKILPGFFHAYKILRNQKPDKILSFGGYIALPVCIVGAALSIPIYIHEQTIAPGTANRIIGSFAKKVFVAFPQAAGAFEDIKTIVIGNPIRKAIFKPDESTRHISPYRPIIYITGGSLGSHSLNVHIEHILHSLLKKYVVVHQTGSVSEFDDFGRLNKIKDPHYIVKQHFISHEVAYFYNKAHLIVCRAGANTIFELIALQKPAVLVPLPWSARNEQKKQAQLLFDAGVAEVFDQTHDCGELLNMIEKIMKNIPFYKQKYKRLSSYNKNDAAGCIASEIS